MTEAAAWLEPRIADAPDSLRTRMRSALQATTLEATVADRLALAAMTCLHAALQAPAERASALDLLAADALLTHACEAAAENGADALLTFTETWDTSRFQELLDNP